MSLATDGFSAITNDFILFVSPLAFKFTYYSMKKALRPEKGQLLFRRNALLFYMKDHAHFPLIL